jgi:predicted ATPase
VATLVAVGADLAGDPATLVLDNCEHVLAGTRTAIAELLRSCPDLTVLTTSRQPLAIAGERVLPVAPLATGVGGPAAALFLAAIERAGGERPTQDEAELLEGLCERLDGLPLALELAAPLVRTLGLQGVSDGLARRFQLFDVAWDATGRERDLRGTVAWSETLLPPPSRPLLRDLSVFAGPFTSTMVAEVFASQSADLDQALAGLADRSLLEPIAGAPGRYRLLENVRAYGREALGESAFERLRNRHASWIAARCDQAYDRFWDGDEVTVMRSLTDMTDEVRAAVGWVVESGDVDLALRIAAGLHGAMFLGVRTDMAAWMRLILEHFGDATHPRLGAVWGARAHWLLTCEGDAGAAAEAASRTETVGIGSPTPAVLWLYRVEAALQAYDVDEAQRLLESARDDGLPGGWDLVIETLLGAAEMGLGNADRAAERLVRLRPVIEERGGVLVRELVRVGTALLARPDDPAATLAVLRDVLATLLAAENRFAAQLVAMTTAAHAGRSGDLDLARITFEDVLGRWGAVGAWRYEWNTIREVITLLSTCGADEDVVVLDAAGRRSATAPVLIGEQLQRLDAAVVRARERLAPDVFAAALQRGARLTDRGALAHTRNVVARVRP